jgi:iron-sulfur cluster assembly protein
MLAISDGAVQAIRKIFEDPSTPDGGGVRIARGTAPNSGGPQPLELMIVEAPSAGDQIVEEQGAQVFLDQEAAELLSDKRLDAETDGLRIGFTIEDQEGPAAPEGPPL